MDKITMQQALADGFTVDNKTYPWFAYKGPRFAPTEWRYVLTDAEALLIWILQGMLSSGHEEFCRQFPAECAAARAAIARVLEGE